MPIWTDKRAILLWGYGREGRAAYHFLKERCPAAQFFVYADQQDPTYDLPFVHDPCGPDFDLVVRSPGVSVYDPLFQKIKIPVTTTTNLWFEAYPEAQTIVVTGTKGKSTTASLIHHMMKSLGKDSVLAGNIGVPLLLQKPGKDITVIELSSYQTSDLVHAPDYFLVTNLYPEHLTWHRTVEDYYRDKMRPAFLHEKTHLLFNERNDSLKAFVGAAPVQTAFQREDGFHVKDNALYDGDRMISVRWPLKGAHNLENLAAAMTALRVMGEDPMAALGGLQDFVPLKHRLQELGEKDGVLYVDDSISTVPETTLAALQTYRDCSCILLMGGQDRGQNYTHFVSALSAYAIKHIFCLPDNGAQIAALLKENNMPHTLCESLADAVSMAQHSAEAGDVVLLSPAAPSYGRFKNFEERGITFQRLCGFEGV